MWVLMFPSTNIALLTEYLYSVMLVNEDLYRVCLSRKLSVFFKIWCYFAEIEIFNACKEISCVVSGRWVPMLWEKILPLSSGYMKWKGL